MKRRLHLCGCFAPAALRDGDDDDEFSGRIRKVTTPEVKDLSIDSPETTAVDFMPVSIERIRSWISEDFLDCISEVDELNDIYPEAPSATCKIPDELTRIMLDDALAAQKVILGWHCGDGSNEFKDSGKAGKVKLGIIPAKGETMQVVKGTASFGAGELELEEVVEFLTDVERKGKYDSQFAQGHKKRGLYEDHSTGRLRRLDLDYAAYKAQWSVSGRDCVLASVVEKIADNMWIMSSRSCEYPGYGEGEVLPGYVRCKIVNAGNVVERDEESGEIFVTMYSQMSIGGNIPTWIVNKAQARAPGALQDMYNGLKKEKASMGG